MRLRKLMVGVLLVALSLLPVSSSAQTIAQVKPITATASLTTATCTLPLGDTGCIGVTMGGYTHVSVQLTGTWTGTVTFQSTVDGTNWVSQNMLPSTGTQTAVATVTGNGVWYSQQPLSVSAFRVNFTTASSATVVATVRATL